MIALFYLVLQILKLYSYVVIANVIISWLIAFNVLNTQNRFVYAILDLTYRLTAPFLIRIRGENWRISPKSLCTKWHRDCAFFVLEFYESWKMSIILCKLKSVLT